MIDSGFLIVLAIGVFKGWRKGLIGALFSLLAFIIGLAAALKLSSAVANYLSEQYPATAKWVPFISFTLVFIVIALLVRFAGKIIETSFSAIMGGLLNRISGSIIYALLYIIIFSVFVYFAAGLHLVSESSLNSSVCYPYIRSLPSDAMTVLGKMIPWFKNVFSDLQDFFGQFGNKINEK